MGLLQAFASRSGWEPEARTRAQEAAQAIQELGSRWHAGAHHDSHERQDQWREGLVLRISRYDGGVRAFSGR